MNRQDFNVECSVIVLYGNPMVQVRIMHEGVELWMCRFSDERKPNQIQKTIEDWIDSYLRATDHVEILTEREAVTREVNTTLAPGESRHVIET